MDTNDPKVQQLLLGAAVLAVGLWGLLVPYEWNILRLKRSFARRVSDRTNRAIPKILGSVLTVVGVAILIVAAAL